ncbi:MAG: NAD(P)/FAD-dependent oxidoreductase [Salinivirgaceae bacterium]
MKETEVLIVGQGLAGTLLSHELNKLQIDHLVISNQQMGASHIAAGMYNPLVFKRLTKSWMVDDLLPIMSQTYQELEALLQISLLHHLPIAKIITPEQKDWWFERINSQELHNYFDQFITSDEIPGLTEKMTLALIKNSGYINLLKLLQRYQLYLEEQKKFITDDFNYNALEVKYDVVFYKNLKAQKIVFCEGAAAQNNPWIPKGIFYPAKGDVLDVFIETLDTPYIINKDIFILPKGKHRFVLGSTYIHQFSDTRPEPENAQMLLQKAQKLVKSPIGLLKHQVGVRPTVKDRRPVLGFNQQIPAIAFFNGLGTKGVMIGPYFAKHMAKVLSAGSTPIDAEVSINRFFK